MIYTIFAYAIVLLYAALGVVSLCDGRPKMSVIAFLFAVSNAIIFCWK